MMKKLLLHDWHESHAAKMAEFAGYAMSLYYSKPIEEHHAVRKRAGAFDISHMGQLTVEGAKAEAFFQYVLTNNVLELVDGQALYSPICREDGGVLDDLIIYRYNPTRYRVIVNAATREKDVAWLEKHAGNFGIEIKDISAEWCLFAIQGPEALSILAPEVAHPLDQLAYYHFAETEISGEPVFLARTGYTGEPGCEIAVPKPKAEAVWSLLTEKLAIPAIGLAARDTLRLDACMSLYGHELREEWNPLESGLGWAVKLDVAEDFVGKTALLEIKARGAEYASVALELIGRGIPRADYPVLSGTDIVGVVTSGVLSPTTGKSIALARVEKHLAKKGNSLSVEIRGKAVEGVVVSKPFYKNPLLRA